MMVKSAVTANGVQAILSTRPQPSSYIGKAYGPIGRPAKKIVKLARFVSETVQYKTGGFVGVEKNSGTGVKPRDATKFTKRGRPCDCSRF